MQAGNANDAITGTLLTTTNAAILLIIFVICLIDLLDKDKEVFFSRLCSTMKTLGPPDYYPEYMILHGMKAFLGIEGDGLKPDFDSDRQWGKILRNNLSCKDKNCT